MNNKNDMENLFGKNYPNKRTISLWFMRLILSQYKSKNCSQNVTIMVTGCKGNHPLRINVYVIDFFVSLQKSYYSFLKTPVIQQDTIKLQTSHFSKHRLLSIYFRLIETHSRIYSQFCRQFSESICKFLVIRAKTLVLFSIT